MILFQYRANILMDGVDHGLKLSRVGQHGRNLSFHLLPNTSTNIGTVGCRNSA